MTDSAIQAGGVLAFAGLVLLLLRQLVPIGRGLFSMLAAVKDEMTEMRFTFAAWLERDKRRDDKRRRDTAPPFTAKWQSTTVPVPRDEFKDEPSTDIMVIKDELREAEEQRKRSRGERAPTRGEHKD